MMSKANVNEEHQQMKNNHKIKIKNEMKINSNKTSSEVLPSKVPSPGVFDL